MIPHEDDILEYALNNGLNAAAEKYSIDKSKVYDIVKAFKIDVEDGDGDCPCERDRKAGLNPPFCFVCYGPSHKERINL